MGKKNFILAVNPVAGTKKWGRALNTVKPVFDSNGADVDVIITEYAGHTIDLLRDMNLSGVDGFCIIGGDGTLYEAINGLLARKDKLQVPIGVIPSGTGNSLMTDLDCLDLVEAAEKIIGGKTRKLDVAHVKMADEEVYAFNIIGWGMVTDINVKAEKIRWMGGNRYTVTTLIEVMKLFRRNARIVMDGEEIEDDWIFAIGCNTMHTGKGMRIAPHAELDDGKIDLVLVRGGTRRKLLKLFPKIFNGSHVTDPIVEYHQVTEFAIYPREQEGLNIDGELIGSTPIDVKVIPKAFSVFV